ncbi:hypothetical protein ID866_5489 [Astraeus odoratus]|nr:hypothetical protein ID866_5489 [Astraeus odoratus]
MANPRQRHKRKSNHKPVSHSRRAKRLQKKMPSECQVVVQNLQYILLKVRSRHDAVSFTDERWYIPVSYMRSQGTTRRMGQVENDAAKVSTMISFYAALGLQHTLNPISSGGSEVDLRYTPDKVNALSSVSDSCEKDQVASTAKKGVPTGFGRILRDATGAVVGIELPEEEEEESGTHSEDVEMRELASPNVDRCVWVQSGTQKSASAKEGDNDIVELLECQANATQRTARHTSQGERLYLARLVTKYGDDYERMGGDRRLNPEQRTIGELRRAIAKAGGIEALYKE